MLSAATMRCSNETSHSDKCRRELTCLVMECVRRGARAALASRVGYNPRKIQHARRYESSPRSRVPGVSLSRTSLSRPIILNPDPRSTLVAGNPENLPIDDVRQSRRSPDKVKSSPSCRMSFPLPRLGPIQNYRWLHQNPPTDDDLIARQRTLDNISGTAAIGFSGPPHETAVIQCQSSRGKLVPT